MEKNNKKRYIFVLTFQAWVNAKEVLIEHPVATNSSELTYEEYQLIKETVKTNFNRKEPMWNIEQNNLTLYNCTRFLNDKYEDEENQ